jgi:hypothetical protein
MAERFDSDIQDALATIAATAVSPERVRARIGARARVHRQRRMLLAGAGLATAVAAVGVPLALQDRRAEPALPPAPELDLMYRPGWLPDGVAERYRSVTFDTGTGVSAGATRRWYPAGSKSVVTVPEGSVSLVVGEPLEPEVSEPVTVGPARGIRWVSDQTAYVQWQPAGGPVIVASSYRTADDRGNALRMARSVEPTSESVALTLRVPDRFAGTAVFEVYPAGFLTFDNGWRPDGYQSLAYDGLLLATTPPESGMPFQAVERDGIMVYLTSDAPITAGESREILEQVECRPPDLSWVKE